MLSLTKRWLSLTPSTRLASILNIPSSKLPDYWLSHIDRVDRPSAIQLIPQLVPHHITGFDSSRTLMAGILGDIARWKEEHPDKVILVRIGDFFETFGVDALMLVQHAGLNPMAGKCRAGCPKGNLQQTLKALTDAGLSVAVFEEANSVETRFGLKKRKLRYLSQIVTPGMPSYLLPENNLTSGEINYQAAKPFAYIRASLAGVVDSSRSTGHIAPATQNQMSYSLALIHADSKETRLHEELTEEGLLSLLDASGGFAEPVFVSGNFSPKIDSCLPSRKHKIPNQHNSITTALSTIYQSIAKELALAPETSEPHSASYRLVSSDHTNSADQRMQPLYRSAAQSLGLCGVSAVPNLASECLPTDAHAFAFRFMNSWMLSPPPQKIRTEMQHLLKNLENLEIGLPIFRPISVPKLVRLLESRSGNPSFFQEIKTCLNGFLKTADLPLSSSLMEISQYQSGIQGLSIETLKDAMLKAVSEIDSVVTDGSLGSLSSRGSPGISVVPSEFYDANEGSFVGNVNVDLTEIEIHKKNLEIAIRQNVGLVEVARYDSVNNLIYWKVTKKKADVLGKKLVPCEDRKGEKISGKFTTEEVSLSLNKYLHATAKAELEAKKMLRDLSTKLLQMQKELILASHWVSIAGTAVAHLEISTRKGWTHAHVIPYQVKNSLLKPDEKIVDIEGLTPYWLEAPPRGSAVLSEMSMSMNEGPWVLTAPNMSGKSTFIRSVASVALLANCGFMVPARKAVVKQLTHLMVVSPGGDRPNEGLSAFAAEAESVGSVMRSVMYANENVDALVLVDEFGRGTSPLDGVALTAALLESLHAHNKNIACIFATHLHEIFSLKLPNNIKWLQMNGHSVEPGRCFDSKGIEVAVQFGIPASVGFRASEIRQNIMQMSHTGPTSKSSVKPNSSQPTYLEADPTLAQPLISEHDIPLIETPAIVRKSHTFSVESRNQNSVNLPSHTPCEISLIDAETLHGAIDSVIPNFSIFKLNIDETVPPSVQAGAVVYFLLLHPEFHIQANNHSAGREEGFLVYVGETENFSRRMTQHKRKFGVGRFSKIWAVPVENKGRARTVETALIRRLEKFPALLSRADGRRKM